MKNVALHNLGCKVNAYELEVMGQMLQENGYQIVSFDEKADIYIINTCSVTNIADRKSRQMLHQAKKRNPDAMVVAAGCYVQAGEEQLKKDSAVDLLVGNDSKKEIVRILNEYFEKEKKDSPIAAMNVVKEYMDMQLTDTAEHTRAYIKIQDGCNLFCSYCLIPYVRGRVRSRKKEEILAEVSGLAKKGFKEVVLTGIHLSSYGLDFDGISNIKEGESYPHKHLLDVIKEIDRMDGIKRIRLGSLEPRIITEEFVEKLTEVSKLCPHFHLSLQSGCDETLKRMNRHYDTGEYLEKVALLRRKFEHPAITTDIIVGFPGETEEEFLETKSFLEKICFYEMHIFPYSRREGTAAAAAKNQITEKEKKRRSDILLKLSEKQSKEFRRYYVEKRVEVLWEETKGIENRKVCVGYTKEYVKVSVTTEKKLEGTMGTGVVEGVSAVGYLSIQKNEALNF